MNIKEIRIGNYLLFDNELCKVETISESGVISAKLAGKPIVIKDSASKFSEIKITFEWLESLGFKREDSEDGYSSVCSHSAGEVVIAYDGSKSYFPKAQPNNSRDIKTNGIAVRSIHKLQNLAFELEDVELSIS